MYYLHKATSAVSCIKPNASQREATLRCDVRFPTVYRRIYRRKFLTLSNQTSRCIRKCIRIGHNCAFYSSTTIGATWTTVKQMNRGTIISYHIACGPSVSSDQHTHRFSLTRVFVDTLRVAKGPKRLQFDLVLLWANMQSCRKCCAPAYIKIAQVTSTAHNPQKPK